MRKAHRASNKGFSRSARHVHKVNRRVPMRGGIRF